MSDFGKRLLSRLGEATDRSDKTLANNQNAVKSLDKVMPIIDKNLEGNQVVLRALREVYSALEGDGEELSTAKGDLQDAKAALEISNNLLEQANFDLDNIKTAFGNDSPWFGNHLPTIKVFTEVLDIPLWEIALDETENERFVDIAHAVQRSGKKRQKAAIK